MWVRSLGQKDPLEEGKATHSGILAWSLVDMDRGAWRAVIHRVTHSQTRLRRLSTHARTSHKAWTPFIIPLTSRNRQQESRYKLGIHLLPSPVKPFLDGFSLAGVLLLAMPKHFLELKSE